MFIQFSEGIIIIIASVSRSESLFGLLSYSSFFLPSDAFTRSVGSYRFRVNLRCGTGCSIVGLEDDSA